jgi:hypothetical protein
MKKLAVLIAGGTLATAMLLSVLGNGNSHLAPTPTTLVDGGLPQAPILPTPPPPKPPPPPNKAV